MKSVQDLHQSALAGAVLPQQRVNFSRLDGEVNFAVGHDAGESLDDLPHRERGQVHLLKANSDFSASDKSEGAPYLARTLRQMWDTQLLIDRLFPARTRATRRMLKP